MTALLPAHLLWTPSALAMDTKALAPPNGPRGVGPAAWLDSAGTPCSALFPLQPCGPGFLASGPDARGPCLPDGDQCLRSPSVLNVLPSCLCLIDSHLCRRAEIPFRAYGSRINRVEKSPTHRHRGWGSSRPRETAGALWVLLSSLAPCPSPATCGTACPPGNLSGALWRAGVIGSPPSRAHSRELRHPRPCAHCRACTPEAAK